MGTVIDLQAARRAKQQRVTAADPGPLARLERALASLEDSVRAPHVRASVNAGLIEHELSLVHRLIDVRDLETATERIERLRARLDHATARRSS